MEIPFQVIFIEFVIIAQMCKWVDFFLIAHLTCEMNDLRFQFIL